MHRKERGHANPFDVQLSHTMAGPFGSNHGDVHAGRRNHLAEVNVEAVREHQGLTRAKMRRNGLLIDLFCVWSGINITTKSASFAASSTVRIVRPAALALSAEGLAG